MLWLTLTVAVMMLSASRAEESSILAGATVDYVAGSFPGSYAIDGNFKTLIESSYSSPASPGDGSQEMSIHLSSEKNIVSAFIVNHVAY